MESSNSIDVKVISCKDLKAFNFFQKLSAYSLVSLGAGDGDKSQRQQPQKTPIDRHGNRNPEWNHEVRFDLEQIAPPQRDLLFLDFYLFSDGIFGGKPLGEVHVPLTDLVRDFNDAVRFVSYQIRSADGKPNGVLNFSYRVNLKGKIASYPTVDTSPAACLPATGGDLAPPAPVPHYPPPAMVQYNPPPGPVGFPAGPPDPYGYRPVGLGYGSHVYPTVEGASPYYGDAWRRGLRWDGSRGF